MKKKGKRPCQITTDVGEIGLGSGVIFIADMDHVDITLTPEETKSLEKHGFAATPDGLLVKSGCGGDYVRPVFAIGKKGRGFEGVIIEMDPTSDE